VNQVMTLERLASFAAVNDLVGARPDRRWGRASLATLRSDGHSIASWFETHTPEERTKLVREALLGQEPWGPLLRVQIPKKPGSVATRPIDMPLVLDQARLYLINAWLSKHAHRVLTRVAVAFRSGVQMAQVVLGAYERMQTAPFASVVDIAGFYDNIAWHLVDRVIDELPADERVQALLRDLTRVDVIERRSGHLVERTQGIPQGLSVSPVIANLVMNEFDQRVAHAVSRFGGSVRRYCDDILPLAPSRDANQRAIDILRDRLARLGLKIKAGTGKIADTRADAITWLGISFGPAGLDVPSATIDKKAFELQGKIDHAIIGPEGVEDRLMSLHKHYRRIIQPGRAQKLIASIRERLITTKLSLTRKEDLENLRTLINDRQSRGPYPSQGNPRGQPDGLDDHRGGPTNQGNRREDDLGRHL